MIPLLTEPIGLSPLESSFLNVGFIFIYQAHNFPLTGCLKPAVFFEENGISYYVSVISVGKL